MCGDLFAPPRTKNNAMPRSATLDPPVPTTRATTTINNGTDGLIRIIPIAAHGDLRDRRRHVLLVGLLQLQSASGPRGATSDPFPGRSTTKYSEQKLGEELAADVEHIHMPPMHEAGARFQTDPLAIRLSPHPTEARQLSAVQRPRFRHFPG